ncbi:glycosyltransferase [Desulfonatronospira thiodismutans]|uniref:glycosyltransferase n=1 Tax=Desulfonatronospira thiodismutans TaxID=488939 RepID=UPI001ABF6F10|nr:glycosyltransferase [Desulfonatronospira thiodismutans]
MSLAAEKNDDHLHIIRAKSGDQEGLGLVIVEAMGCGCPVIASDIPAVHDTVIHNQTGILVRLGDPEVLARTVAGILDHPDQRSNMAKTAILKVLEKFDRDITAGKYLELFSNH